MLNLNHSSPVVDADVVILAGDIYVRNKGIAWARGKFEHIPVNLCVKGIMNFTEKRCRSI